VSKSINVAFSNEDRDDDDDDDDDDDCHPALRAMGLLWVFHHAGANGLS